jgi:uncharacterized protein
MISFFVTSNCNLNCSYCYVDRSEHANQTLDFEFAKLGMDEYFLTDMKKHIRFQGPGEPTCAFNLLKKIRDYAHNTVGDKLTAEIQTNGIFGREIRDWLARNIDIIWVSCDGLPEEQDRYRRTKKGEPTSKLLEENVKCLTQNCRGITGIRSTITSENVNNQEDSIEYFYSLGVKHVWTDPIFPSVGEKEVSDSMSLMEYAERFLKAKKFADKKGIFYGSFLACNFDEEVNYSCRACLPVPHLTTDGYVSACDMALFGEVNSPMSALIYGKWDKENNRIVYDETKINNLRSRCADNMPGCKGCSAKYHCAGYCLGEVTNETGNMFGKKTKVCDPIRYLLKNLTSEQCTYKYSHP